MPHDTDPLQLCAHDIASRAAAMVNEALPLARRNDVHHVDHHEHALAALHEHVAAFGELLAIYEDTINRRRALSEVA